MSYDLSIAGYLKNNQHFHRLTENELSTFVFQISGYLKSKQYLVLTLIKDLKQLSVTSTFTENSLGQLSVSSKFTDFLLLMDVSKQHIYQLFAI